MSLAEFNTHPHQINTMLLEGPIQPSILSAELIDNLIQQMRAFPSLINRVWQQLDYEVVELEELSANDFEMLIFLARRGLDEPIADLLPDNFQLDSLNKNSCTLLNNLIRSKEALQIVLAKLHDESISLNQLTFSQLGVLLEITRSGGGKQLVKRLTLETITNSASSAMVYKLVEYLLPYLKHHELMSLLPRSFSLDFIANDHGTFILEKMLNQDPGYAEQILAEAEQHLRKPIGREDLGEYHHQFRWPSLNEQIEALPINQQTVEKMKFGWHRALLEKTHSMTIVYWQLETKTYRKKNVIFRNNWIEPKSLAAYQEAAEVLPPGYVSTPRYEELSTYPEHNKMKPLFRAGGFREVYAGPSLRSVPLQKIPKIIFDEIIAQKNFILLKLKQAGIDHGHTHEGNFNVRFLLEFPNGEKLLSFDLHEALGMVENNYAIITPLVILRDWDIAKIKKVDPLTILRRRLRRRRLRHLRR